MSSRVVGIFLILLGIAIFFPQIFTKAIFKFILAIYLIVVGFKILMGKHGC